MLVAQQKLSGAIKSALIYELKMQHFFTQTWKSIHIVCFQVKDLSVAGLNLDENLEFGRNFRRNG